MPPADKLVTLFYSQENQILQEILLKTLSQLPSDKVFNSSLIICPNKQKLSKIRQDYAVNYGCATNHKHMTTSSAINHLATIIADHIHKDNIISSNEQLVWFIFDLLQQPWVKKYEQLSYMVSIKNQQAVYQLSQQIAQLFLRYQLETPDRLILWQQGKNNNDKQLHSSWQQELWLKLTTEKGYYTTLAVASQIQTNPAVLDKQLLQKLPDAIHFFLLPTVAPLHHILISYLSKYIPIFFYWQQPLSAEHIMEYSLTNELTTTGSKKRNLWHNTTSLSKQYYVSFNEYHPTAQTIYCQAKSVVEQPLSALTWLRKQFATISQKTINPCPVETPANIYIHPASNEQQEVQNCLQWLLQLQQQNSYLTWPNIAIFCTDLTKYAPIIQQEWLSLHQIEEQKQFATNEITPLQVTQKYRPKLNEVVSCLCDILQLDEQLFSVQAIKKLMLYPCYQKHFLNNEVESESFFQLVEDAGIIWGIDTAYYRKKTTATAPKTTWQQGLARCYLGWAINNDNSRESVFFQDVYCLNGIAMTVGEIMLPQLHNMVDWIEWLHPNLTTKKSLLQWLEYISEITIVSLKLDSEQTEQWQHFLQHLFHKCHLITEPTIDIQLFCNWLQNQYQKYQNFPTTTMPCLLVTDTNQEITEPYQVIALLGMSKQQFFTNKDRQLAFDLLTNTNYNQQQNHHFFGSVLLNCQQHLWCSYLTDSAVDASPLMSAAEPIQQLTQLIPHYHLINNPTRSRDGKTSQATKHKDIANTEQPHNRYNYPYFTILSTTEQSKTPAATVFQQQQWRNFFCNQLYYHWRYRLQAASNNSYASKDVDPNEWLFYQLDNHKSWQLMLQAVTIREHGNEVTPTIVSQWQQQGILPLDTMQQNIALSSIQPILAIVQPIQEIPFYYRAKTQPLAIYGQVKQIQTESCLQIVAYSSNLRQKIAAILDLIVWSCYQQRDANANYITIQKNKKTTAANIQIAYNTALDYQQLLLQIWADNQQQFYFLFMEMLADYITIKQKEKTTTDDEIINNFLQSNWLNTAADSYLSSFNYQAKLSQQLEKQFLWQLPNTTASKAETQLSKLLIQQINAMENCSKEHDSDTLNPRALIELLQQFTSIYHHIFSS